MIRHILADGRKVDSIEGFVIPRTGPTAVVYQITADFIQRKAASESEKKMPDSQLQTFVG